MDPNNITLEDLMEVDAELILRALKLKFSVLGSMRVSKASVQKQAAKPKKEIAITPWHIYTKEVAALVKTALDGRKAQPGYHMKILSLIKNQEGFSVERLPTLEEVTTLVNENMGKHIVTPTMVKRNLVDEDE